MARIGTARVGARAKMRGDENLGARAINVALGGWLFVSAFLWEHTAASQANAWVTGALIFAFGLLALVVPAARYLDTAAAVWLFFSTLWIPHVFAATAWHDAILAVIVFAISLAPSGSETRRGVGFRREARV